MTTEIAILNRQGVALAADSAVTVGRERVWKTANKLFSLGPSHDIGVMIHGSAEFLGFPWETIIKMFRQKCQGADFATVKECADALVEFATSDEFRNEELERVGMAGQFMDIMEKVNGLLSYDSKIEFRKNLIALMKAWTLTMYSDEHRPVYNADLNYDEFKKEWVDDIKSLASEIYKQVITKAVLDEICKTMFEYARREVHSTYSTGVVVAGFGSKEALPNLECHIFDGRCGDLVRSWRDRERNVNGTTKQIAHVIPFGQADIIYMMMEGISPESIRYIEKFVGNLLDKKSEELVKNYVLDSDESTVERELQRKANRTILDGLKKEFESFRRESSVEPIVNVIRSLPKEEMASMAEAFVDITSLRRRVDSPLESVGGPVDVAVISKGDGFVWIKRKHYFNIDLNRDFLYRKHNRREA